MNVWWLLGILAVSSLLVVGFWLRVEDSVK